MHRKHYLVAVAIAFVVTACAKTDTAPPTAKASELTSPAAPAKLAKLLAVDNIGRRVDIYERTSGPPVDATATSSTYDVDGCTVAVDSKDHAVQWITLQLGPKCSVDLEPILHVHRVVDAKHPLTFLEYEKLMASPAQYQTMCLGPACGNEGGDTFEAVYPAAHANNYIEVAGGAYVDSPGTDEKVVQWKDAILKTTHGDDEYLSMVSCATQKFDKEARATVGSAKLDYISFGTRDGMQCYDGDPVGEDAGDKTADTDDEDPDAVGSPYAAADADAKASADTSAK
ncbi:hypothetical protein [Lysobacter sp. HA18]